jgi:putative ABC transport system permease protein
MGAIVTWLVRTNTPIEATMTAQWMAVAVAGSAATGILFGILPAMRAARLDPVEALRHE